VKLYGIMPGHASIIQILHHTSILAFEVESHVNKVAEVLIRATAMMCENAAAPSAKSGGWSIQGIFRAVLIAAFTRIQGHAVVD
jgi:hypothetical protein